MKQPFIKYANKITLIKNLFYNTLIFINKYLYMLNISKNLLILNFTDFKVTHFNLIYLIILFFILYLILNQLSSFKKNKWLNSIPILVTLSGLLMILFPTYFIEIFKLNSENSFVIEMGAY
ncbi:hypothetical protein LVJ93_02430, partial [Tenacibaculum maritimum]|nr:hypothetical protein [Tenacibaculum maritimum]